MTIDKRMKYEDQKLTKKTKPANQGGGPNYLGKQKEVTVPKKWLSSPDHVVAELAYITPREQKILLDADIYGSLDGKPNKGPGGVMSLQGDLGGWSAPAGGKSGGAEGRGGAGSSSYKDTDHFKMMTGQLAKGQTVKTGPKTRKYAVPEYAKVKQKDGTYKNKYIGSGYKSYGTPSFWGNLFSRGAPGYRGIKGMPAFGGKPGFEARQGPEGFGYYSDKENFGDTRDAMPFGIMGIIANAINKFKKPKDMTEFNKLGLGGTHPAALDFDPDAKIQDTAFSKTLSDKYKYGVGPVPPSDKYKYSDGPRAVNLPGKYEQAQTDYWSDKQVINTPGGEIVIDSQGNEVVDTPNVPMGTPWDNPYQAPEKSMMEDFYSNASAKAPKSQLETWQEMFGEEVTPAGMNQEQIDYLNSVNKMNVNVGNTGAGGFYSYEKPQDVMDQINKLNAESDSLGWTGYDFDPDKIVTGDKSKYAQPKEVYDYINSLQPSTDYNYGQGTIGIKDGGRVRFADGGLATLFTRRG